MEASHAPPPSFETLLIDQVGALAIVRINRPDKRNALDAATRADLLSAMAWAVAEEGVRVVVITGVGDKAFIAGADIGEFAQRTVLQQRASMTGPRIYDAIATCPKPVIAMINGYALGGGLELAMACDLRIASDQAKFGQPEINLAIIPGGGGTQRLPRLIGAGRAMRLILTGELLGAEEAGRVGLVDEVVPHGQLEQRTKELAASIATRSPVALALAKEAVQAAWELPLSAGLALERELFCLAFSSEDRVEGVGAFLQKRTPSFQPRRIT